METSGETKSEIILWKSMMKGTIVKLNEMKTVMNDESEIKRT